MGYRSEVLLYVGPEVMPQFMVTMAKCQGARELCFGSADERVKDYQDIKGSMLFKWGWLKWYDTFPEVEAIIDFMDWCDGEQIPTGEKMDDGGDKLAWGAEFFKFVRLGEEMDDNEERGDAMWGDICINRSIEF
jgi:hypothetical protein|tara:strand:+ start:516 stop:917 length:402 start_codon:yes stop_codon:yes gene_type:complete